MAQAHALMKLLGHAAVACASLLPRPSRNDAMQLKRPAEIACGRSVDRGLHPFPFVPFLSSPNDGGPHRAALSTGMPHALPSSVLTGNGRRPGQPPPITPYAPPQRPCRGPAGLRYRPLCTHGPFIHHSCCICKQSTLLALLHARTRESETKMAASFSCSFLSSLVTAKREQR